MPCCAKLRARLSSGYSRPQSSRRAPESESSVISASVVVESLRAFAYCSFFIFVGCAILINNAAVAPYLASGPSDGSTCPPFDGAMGDAVDPPVMPGEGFDVHTQSHLIRAFGYNNICANWDYSPSREITAMIYPIFEYSLLLYLLLDFVQVWLYHKKGWCSSFFYKSFRIAILFMLIGCAWFRMIFVVIAYQDLSGHTAGFFCLQLTLILTAIMNTWFIIDTKTSFSWLGGQKGTTAVAVAYLVCNLCISPVKLYLTAEIVFKGAPAAWSLNQVGSSYAGEVVDNVWFVFNAILPLIVAFVRMFSEQPLTLTLDALPPNWTQEDGIQEQEEEQIKMVEDKVEVEEAATPEEE